MAAHFDQHGQREMHDYIVGPIPSGSNYAMAQEMNFNVRSREATARRSAGFQIGL
ncbi:hypothetical protein Cflav_PD5587 [Pedosphaera parvula Ellin514]|uniref:Uncharacterized protein n=1 Tax=Pedosphaera parvula (strain Ellin514) TaxID=320771 RepID=B9XBR7_PEDPL|nr:hypothetical protein Cflav_PD5587 [Pedosphaera parvula Ellin514]